MIIPNPPLIKIRDALKSKGYNLWFVGGCVRDSVLGEEPDDIDLCTDATPEEAIEVYKENNLRYFETGIKHGTITVVPRVPSGKDLVPYEITSLRTESEHDGRHAVVAYTRDLIEDLSRRDLTINAMAQDFDGNIIDPFGGMSDLKNERVRMVGNAAERFKEDYLRILRFFRFHARFAGLRPLDLDTVEAIVHTKAGLNDISGERKWQEMRKIIVGPHSATTLRRMQKFGVLAAMHIKFLDCIKAYQCQLQCLSSAAIVLGITIPKGSIDYVMSEWRMSNNERAEARFANLHEKTKDREKYKELLVDGSNPKWVEEMLKYHALESLSDWDVPVFPVDGLDLINKKGIKSGPAIGVTLRTLRERWKQSDYKLTKSQLLNNL